MEEQIYLEQFKQEVRRLGSENLNDLSKVATLNTAKYDNILKGLLTLLWEEAENNNRLEFYLIEIRKLWELHIVQLAKMRNFYAYSDYQKLERPKKFYDVDLPAFIELHGSATPADNSFIKFDVKQQIYWQYLEFAAKLEYAMMATDHAFALELGVIPNFDHDDDPQSGFSFKIRDEFMTELVWKEKTENIENIRDAKEYLDRLLKDAYKGAGDDEYTWLINSILAPLYHEIKIPDVGQHLQSFVVPYSCTKTALYMKIRAIRINLYTSGVGRENLARIFADSGINIRGKKSLDFYELSKRI